MKMVVLQILVIFSLLCMTISVDASGFCDIGVAVPVSESRGLVTFKDATGRNLAIVLAGDDQSERGYLYLVDLDRANVEKIFYPEGVNNISAFASMMSKNGRFYTGAGPILLEFDPITRRFLYHGIPNPKAFNFIDEAFTDGPDNLIYVGTYPDCRLLAFDPQTKKIKDFGQLDTSEKYLSYLIFDNSGWVYAGIGTARCNIVAFNPKTGERRQILEESARVPGTPYVFLGNDGKVYGVVSNQWYRMFEGRGERIGRDKLANKVWTGAINWTVDKMTLTDGRSVRLDLPGAYIDVITNGFGTKRIPIKFKSGGAQITSLVVGPDGYIYGSSAHPMHFFRCKVLTDQLQDLGPVNRLGGGNFAAMATQGAYLIAASYSRGILHIFDTTKPFNGGYGMQPNPWEAVVWSKDIARPRACIAYSDGKTVLMSGFAAYGLNGGGMGIYNLQTKHASLLTHENLILNESTVSMRVLPSGDIVAGTSIEAPGGAQVKSKHATLYILDLKTKKVVFRTNPILGVKAITSLEIGSDGFVYGLCDDSKLFVFDPQRRLIIHQDDLVRYGRVPRQALVHVYNKLYAVMTNGLISIEPGTFRVKKILDVPSEITAGAVFSENCLYFACGSHIWKYFF